MNWRKLFKPRHWWFISRHCALTFHNDEHFSGKKQKIVKCCTQQSTVVCQNNIAAYYSSTYQNTNTLAAYGSDKLSNWHCSAIKKLVITTEEWFACTPHNLPLQEDRVLSIGTTTYNAHPSGSMRRLNRTLPPFMIHCCAAIMPIRIKF